MTAPLSYQKKGALWRAYKQRPSARYVATTCDVSWHTASKYIKELNFPQRLKNLQARANQLVPDDEARKYAENASKVRAICTSVLDELLELHRTKSIQPTAKEADLLMRLDAFLHGSPESRTQHDVSIEWFFDDDEDEDEDDDDDDDADEDDGVKPGEKLKR